MNKRSRGHWGISMADPKQAEEGPLPMAVARDMDSPFDAALPTSAPPIAGPDEETRRRIRESPRSDDEL